MKLEFHAVTPERWKDLETLFGKRGACGGCWCRFWKITRSEYEEKKGEGNRKALRKTVLGGEQPGILAYHNGEPVGWCAVEPRDKFPTLARSRILKPVDDQKVWSAPCFFVRRDFRHRGMTVELLKGASAHARKQGARWIEGYPVQPAKGAMPDAFAYTGFPSAFEKAGFTEVARRSEHRPIYRRKLR